VSKWWAPVIGARAPEWRSPSGFRSARLRIRRLLQHRRKTGSIAVYPQNPGRKPALDEARLHLLRRLVEQQPDATLRELKAGLGVAISDGALISALRRLNLTLKKSHSKPPSKTARR
jgi:transposase